MLHFYSSETWRLTFQAWTNTSNVYLAFFDTIFSKWQVQESKLLAKDRSAKCSSSFSRVYELLPIRSRWKLNQSLQFLTSSDRLGLGIRTQRLWDLPFSLFFHPLHIKHLWMESRLRFGVEDIDSNFQPKLGFYSHYR